MTVRLRNKRTGVIVTVDEATADRFGASHEPVDEPISKPVEAPAPTPTRRKK